MKQLFYAVFLPAILLTGMVVAARKFNSQPVGKDTPDVDKRSAREIWEASPDGMKYLEWEASPTGRKVLAGAAKIRMQVRDSTDMEAEITSMSLPAGSRLGFGLMARIAGTDYIVIFDTQKTQLTALRSLKANEKVILKGRGISMAPKYDYPILAVSYLEKNGQVIYKRVPPKGGC